MRSIKKGFAIVLGVALTLLLAGFVLPDRVSLSREVVINADPETVFTLVGDYHKWSAWSPWATLDPEADFTIIGSGVGQRMTWKSDHPKLGNGAQEIVNYSPPNQVTNSLDFGQMGQAQASIHIHPNAEQTRVVWSFETNMRDGVPLWMQPAATYMGYMMNSFLGPRYEEGLENLKRVAEAQQA